MRPGGSRGSDPDWAGTTSDRQQHTCPLGSGGLSPRPASWGEREVPAGPGGPTPTASAAARPPATSLSAGPTAQRPALVSPGLHPAPLYKDTCDGMLDGWVTQDNPPSQSPGCHPPKGTVAGSRDEDLGVLHPAPGAGGGGEAPVGPAPVVEGPGLAGPQGGDSGCVGLCAPVGAYWVSAVRVSRTPGAVGCGYSEHDQAQATWGFSEENQGPSH